MKESVRKGETKAIQLDNSMLAIKWMDKRAVTALTAIHEDAAVACSWWSGDSDEATSHS